MTVKAKQYKELQYYDRTGSVSLSYTTKKDCSAVLICSTCNPTTTGFSSNSSSCKIDGVEQSCNLIGSGVQWWSDRITFIENLSAGSVIELSVGGTCSDTTYGQLLVAVITNE